MTHILKQPRIMTPSQGVLIADFGLGFPQRPEKYHTTTALIAVNNTESPDYNFYVFRDTLGTDNSLNNITAERAENGAVRLYADIVSGYNTTNSGAVTATQRSFGAAVENKATVWDFSATTYLHFELETPPDLVDVMGEGYCIRVSLCGDSGTTFTNYLYTNPSIFTGGQSKTGKYCVRVPISDITGTSGTPPALSAIKKIVISCFPLSGSSVNLSSRFGIGIRRIYADYKPEKSPVIFSFDDGHPSVYDYIFPLFNKYGWTASVGLNGFYYKSLSSLSSNNGGTNTHMSINQLKTLHAAGWCMSNHTYLHKALVDRIRYSADQTGVATGVYRYSSDYAAYYRKMLDIGATPYIDIKSANLKELIGRFKVVGAKISSSANAQNIDYPLYYGAGTIDIEFGFTFYNDTGHTTSQNFIFACVAGKTEREVVTDYLDVNRNWALDHGLWRGSDIVIYPNGAIAPFMYPFFKEAGYRAGRATRFTYRYDSTQTAPADCPGALPYTEIDSLIIKNGWFDEFNLPVNTILGDTSGANNWFYNSALTPEVANWISGFNKQIANGGAVFPYGHAFLASINDGSSLPPLKADPLFQNIRNKELNGECVIMGFDDWLDSVGVARIQDVRQHTSEAFSFKPKSGSLVTVSSGIKNSPIPIHTKNITILNKSETVDIWASIGRNPCIGWLPETERVYIPADAFAVLPSESQKTVVSIQTAKKVGTGLIVAATNSATVTAGATSLLTTKFLSEITAGTTLYTASGKLLGCVKSVESNTSLTLTANALVAVGSGTTAGSFYYDLSYTKRGAGTISVSTANTNVTGVSSSFLSDLQVGDIITDLAGVQYGTISSISSDTVATLTANSSATASGVGFYVIKAAAVRASSGIVCNKATSKTWAITSSTSSKTVTGTGFNNSTTGASVGDIITASGSVIGVVASIESDTSLTLQETALAAVSGVNPTVTSKVIRGSASNFLTTVTVGETIYLANGLYVGVIASIQSNTILTLEDYVENGTAASQYWTVNSDPSIKARISYGA